MITIKSIEKRLEHLHRLELAGVTCRRQASLGPPVILWVQTRGGSESWEVLPESVASLVVSDLHNDATAERAAMYHRIPKNAPPGVAAQWLQARIGRAILMPDITRRILAA